MPRARTVARGAGRRRPDERRTCGTVARACHAATLGADPRPPDRAHAPVRHADVPAAAADGRRRRQAAVRGRGGPLRRRRAGAQLRSRRARDGGAAGARRRRALPRRLRPRQPRARRAAVGRPRVPHRFGDQAVLRRGGAEAGRGGQAVARRSADPVRARLPRRRRDHGAHAARPHLRPPQLYQHRGHHGRRRDHAGPVHRGADRQLQGRGGRLRAGPRLGVQQLRLRTGRRRDRGGHRQVLACLPGGSVLRATGHGAHRLRQRGRGGDPRACQRLHAQRRTLGARPLPEHDPAACGRRAGVDRGRPAQVEPCAARRPHPQPVQPRGHDHARRQGRGERLRLRHQHRHAARTAQAGARRRHLRLQRLPALPARGRGQRRGALQRRRGAAGHARHRPRRAAAGGPRHRQALSAEEGDRGRRGHAARLRGRVPHRRGQRAHPARRRRAPDLAAQRRPGLSAGARG